MPIYFKQKKSRPPSFFSEKNPRKFLDFLVCFANDASGEVLQAMLPKFVDRVKDGFDDFEAMAIRFFFWCCFDGRFWGDDLKWTHELRKHPN